MVSAGIGYFNGLMSAEPARKNGIDKMVKIQADLLKDYCKGLVATNPGELAKDPPNQRCLYLAIYWDELNQYQAKHLKKYPQIDGDLASAMVGDDIDGLTRNMGLISIANACISYLLIWAIGFVLFYIFRWIKRGFSS